MRLLIVHLEKGLLSMAADELVVVLVALCVARSIAVAHRAPHAEVSWNDEAAAVKAKQVLR